ncbi:MAG: hypothetical protein ABJG33_08965 [Balneola sp.]
MENSYQDLIIRYQNLFGGIKPAGDNIECEIGWYDLLEDLCNYIQDIIDTNRKMVKHQLLITQIKQKDGCLRVYYKWTKIDDEIELMFPSHENGIMNKLEGAIGFAQFISCSICETCGKKGNIQSFNGRVYVSCAEHKLKDG